MSAEAKAAVAERLIARDEAVRLAGKSPPWDAVRRIIDYVVQQELLTEPIVAGWLRTVATGADLWISHKLLQIVISLLEANAVQEAHAIYRCVLGLDDASRWEALAPTMAHHSMLTERGIEPILGRPGLLSGDPESWGRTACDLLGRVVLQHQRDEWPSHLQFMAVVAEQIGKPFEANQPFKVDYDDNPSLWYFSPNTPSTPRERVAWSVEQALREAADLPDDGTFRQLSGFLLNERFAIGIGLQLAVLFDGLRGMAPRHNWHKQEAMRLLMLDSVQEHATLDDFRRLLRRELPKPTDATTSQALTDVIRRSALTEQAKLQELADVADWGALNEEERIWLDKAVAEDALFPPSDPRDEPVIRCDQGAGHKVQLDSSSSGGRHTNSEASSSRTKVAGRPWPHPEDHAVIQELFGMYRRPAGSDAQDAAAERLSSRLTALEVLLGRPEADDEIWAGEILGWCHVIVTDLRADELRRLGRDTEVGMLTEWLFREHERDDEAFGAFLMGRHAFQIVAQGDINPERKHQEMQPFLAHQMRRVREWAQYEISSEERQAAEFRDFDEEDERL